MYSASVYYYTSRVGVVSRELTDKDKDQRWSVILPLTFYLRPGHENAYSFGVLQQSLGTPV